MIRDGGGEVWGLGALRVQIGPAWFIELLRPERFALRSSWFYS